MTSNSMGSVRLMGGPWTECCNRFLFSEDKRMRLKEHTIGSSRVVLLVRGGLPIMSNKAS